LLLGHLRITRLRRLLKFPTISCTSVFMGRYGQF
jgi:hypothetical protein